MTRWLTACLLLTISTLAQAVDIQEDTLYPQVKLETSMGTIIVELNRTRAPITVDNFLTYVVTGQYDNTLFHRIIPEFVVQGGGLDLKKEARPENAAIVNESGNGLSNGLGTIAILATTIHTRPPASFTLMLATIPILIHHLAGGVMRYLVK